VARVVFDGGALADDQLVSHGLTSTREKRTLGLVQTASEEKRVIASFLPDLSERGFPREHPLKVVLEGANGLRPAIRDVFDGEPVSVQWCQWHTRENVGSYLAKQDHPSSRRKLKAVHAHQTYADAKRGLELFYRELRVINESAVASFAEGLEETITLHPLNVFPELGVKPQTPSR